MDDLYVSDAHAFAYYLVDKLPSKANAIFRKAEVEECKMVIPSIAVAELIHVFERTRVENKIWELFDRIDVYPNFLICPLDEKLLKIIPEIRLPELHDRIITGTCVLLKAKGLITKDPTIKKLGLVKTIW